MRRLCSAIIIIAVFSTFINGAKSPLEQKLFKNYDPKHRPVKQDSTTTQVAVYLSIGHIEKVDEYEQTMLVHGYLWATWTDEYLNWTPAENNNVTMLQIDSWQIWQPALALYNSARGNSWHLYMHGLPSTVFSSGKVWASGSFSFFVTCQFDFSEWPYDTQSCPIVIADWVYDLSRVNLSDPSGKPAVRLSYDPLGDANAKKHVSGWEVKDTWRRHCYWGPQGCKDQMPEGQPEWYWSLLEFGLKITRHSPYFTYTTVYPLMTVALVNLLAFWTESHRTASTLLMMSLAVQSIIGWVLLRKMPPGSGGTPKLIKLYCLNLILSALSYTVIVVSAFLERLLPEDIDFGLHITELPDLLGLKPFFNAPAISFDPQELGEKDNDAPLGESEYNSPITTIGMSTAFDNPSAVGPNGALEGSPTPAPSSSQAEDDDGTTLIPLSSLAADVEQHRNKKNKTLNRSDDVEANEFDENATKLQIQLTTVRRCVFVLVAFSYCLGFAYFFI